MGLEAATGSAGSSAGGSGGDGDSGATAGTAEVDSAADAVEVRTQGQRWKMLMLGLISMIMRMGGGSPSTPASIE